MTAFQVLPPDIPPSALEVVRMFFASVVAIALGVPIIRVVARRWERGPQQAPKVSADVTARLERIEQAVEAVAIEVERIAEGQRFSVKLMAEQQRSLPGSDVSS